MRKKIIITVGGTGGHVYPAIALAKKLQDRCDVIFVGGGLKKNRYFTKDEFHFKETACGSISLRKPFQSFCNVGKILQGIFQGKNILSSFQPDLVVGFGSYHTLPLLAAAYFSSTPFMLHEANRKPGKVNRLFSPYAVLTGIHFKDTPLKGKTVPIKMPLREGFYLGNTTKDAARNYFNLDPKVFTILVFGGSQGAEALNRIVKDALINLSKKTAFQVLHFTGNERGAELLKKEYQERSVKSCVKDFEKRMDLSWQAADLVISRSGAGTLAESVEYEVPSILVPYPHAMDNHQEANADYMVEQVCGAIKCLERDLNSEVLAKKINALLEKECENLKKMKRSIRNYKEKDPSKELFETVVEFLAC
jgi:UDP-N-acetylglucosamine--N-acetylmuramyl-(pentapeptide) pyrophosphoryl-undecaprenol N-acetylglucosamine transferase